MFGHSVDNAIVIEAEPDIVQFIQVLVRALHPRYVIETGCYHGTTSKAIGEALAIGHLDTMDIDSYSVEMAEAATAGLPVTVHLCNSFDFIPDRPIDFAFLDSGVDNVRSLELEHFAPYLADNATVAVHDSRYIDISFSGWRWVDLQTPMGLLLLQRD